MARSGRPTTRYDDLPSDRRRRLTARLLRRAADAEGDERARLVDEVILLNIGVAHTIASRYRGRGVSDDDLEQVAAAALVRAAHQFDRAFDRDFLAYAVPTIRGELRHHFRDQGWTIRPPRRIQELWPRVVAERDRQRAAGVVDPPLAAVAEALGEPEEDVREAMQVSCCYVPASLDLPLNEDGTASLGQAVPDPQGDREEQIIEARVAIRPVVRRLAERDRRLLDLRFREGLTQREIAEAFGVTQTQVSRLLTRVLRDLRRSLGEIED